MDRVYREGVIFVRGTDIVVALLVCPLSDFNVIRDGSRGLVITG